MIFHNPNHQIINNVKKRRSNIFQRTDNQRAYVEALEDYFSPLIFGLGPAGTGKTLFGASWYSRT